MPDSNRIADEPECCRCGKPERLLTVLHKNGEHPTYRIFRCVGCGFMDWVAQHRSE